ncbi:aminotransferase class I/II-fold pyridoxal phosphate-dependent enzyme [Anaerococcus sp. Marseille-P3915]|uniref:aminotransferase class I/II-fold pyridoxal phosphate-dependent enzyme n=1 Tax=Anaerococcus sp. Marseille-P3915 TaxID=2057799 RepID=UPI000D0BA546|nr:aminotransferase class I/II-fold pyridoxal phosphate-dependent enzyme [Anaerococcus sp. Marseille-P3915]
MSMTIKKATWPIAKDLAFDINNKANAAIEKYGRENVINAALGTLADDSGKIIALDSVYDRLSQMDRSIIASYAPIEGEDGFREAVLDSLFENHRPKAFMTAISTPGGTGAIRSGVFTYADEGDPVLSHDYYWGPYKKICDEFGRDFITYNFFTDDYKFDIEAYKVAMAKALENKDRLVSIINSPGNNPTGYSLSDDEWDEVIKACQDLAKAGKKITLIVDVAYIEYAGSGKQKEFFEKFTGLDPNFFVIVAYSMSKSHTAYGLRSGAAIGISSKKEIIDEFENSLAHSARCNWSNGVHAPQLILKDLENDKDGYKKELENLRLMLEKRAEIFVREAKAKKLAMIPYFGGFFTFIPTDMAFEIAENLEKENIFTIPQAKGIRVAICATNKKDIIKLVDRLSYFMANL